MVKQNRSDGRIEKGKFESRTLDSVIYVHMTCVACWRFIFFHFGLILTSVPPDCIATSTPMMMIVVVMMIYDGDGGDDDC